MKILIVKPLELPYVGEIDGTLASMQEVVGGYIEAIYPFADETVALVCNEEGKNRGLPFNRALYDEEGNLYDIVAGTFFLCLADPESEAFESLSEEQLAFYAERFCGIEIYIGR